MKTKFLTLSTLILITTSAICSQEPKDALDLPTNITTMHVLNHEEDVKPLFSNEFLDSSGSNKVLMNYRRLSTKKNVPTDKDIKTPL